MADNTTQRNQDALLLEYMRRLDGQKEGRKAVFINLAALQPMNRREQHVRAAASSFEDIVSSLAGQMFVLQDTDLLCIYKSEASGQVENVVQRVRFLFSDDPLLDDDASSAVEFATWLWNAIMTTCSPWFVSTPNQPMGPSQKAGAAMCAQR